jgi:hypothetical protein
LPLSSGHGRHNIIEAFYDHLFWCFRQNQTVMCNVFFPDCSKEGNARGFSTRPCVGTFLVSGLILEDFMTFRLCIGVLCAGTFVVQLASASIVGPLDTFQSGTTEGWFAGGLGMGSVPPVPPHVVANGGPLGAGDEYLVITSQGGTGAGSKLVALNMSRWAGDYSSISGISMDLRNLGTTDLTIRLLLEDPMFGPPADQAVTTFGAVLPTGDAWTKVFFPISASSLTVLSGNIAPLLTNTTLLRIIDSPTPSDAVTIAGVLGVDNIQAVPEPATWFLTGAALFGLAVKGRRGQGIGSITG